MTFISSSADLTTREFQRLQKDAVKMYVDACWTLANILTLGKNKFGRKQLLEMSSLPSTKIDWFTAIGSLPYRTSALPELHYETCGVKNGKKWLKKAVSEGWNPNELRKEIRESNADHYRAPKRIETAKWLGQLLSVEAELRSFQGDKTKAAERLKPLVDMFHSFSSGSCS